MRTKEEIGEEYERERHYTGESQFGYTRVVWGKVMNGEYRVTIGDSKRKYVRKTVGVPYQVFTVSQLQGSLSGVGLPSAFDFLFIRSKE